MNIDKTIGELSRLMNLRAQALRGVQSDALEASFDLLYNIMVVGAPPRILAELEKAKPKARQLYLNLALDQGMEPLAAFPQALNETFSTELSEYFKK